MPQGWQLKTIPQLVGKDGVFVDGDWVESKDQDPDGEVRLIQLADIGDGQYRNKSQRFLTLRKAKELGCTFLKEGDVLIARMPGPLGRACIFPGDAKDAVTVVDVAIARPGKDEFDTKWLMHFVNAPAFRKAVASMEAGSTRKRISRKNLGKILLPLPPLPQQRPIAAEIDMQFSRLDEAATALKRIQANLKRYKAAVLKTAVEGKLTEKWRKEHPDVEPADQLLKRILAERRANWEAEELAKMKAKGIKPKDDMWKKKYKEPAGPDTANLPQLPEGWVWASVEQLGDVFGGLTKNPKRASLPLQLPYLRVANVYANELRLDEIEQIGIEERELAKLLVLTGDLLIVEGNGSPEQIGRVAIWEGSIEPCVHQNHLIKIRLSPACLPKWTLYWLLSANGRNYIREVSSSTSGLYTLSTGKVGGLPVPLPSLTEQQQIADEIDRRLSVSEDLEVTIETNLKRAERLRQTTLQRAFYGRGSIT
nr:restriction endonuclease subunit S [Geotalea sp. SG265]